MIPYLDDKYEMLRMLGDAIKGVYASVYYKDSKAYMQATSNVIDQEKMAVILQEVVGTQYGDRYYPAISGVAAPSTITRLMTSWPKKVPSVWPWG